MSSHHVVREKQEPALVIANGEACSFELLGQLLEWSPTVVALDGAVNRVEELGLKIDVIIGDFDSITGLEELERRQQPVRIIHTPDQEKTDLEKAIEWLIGEGYGNANIVWATGRRADHYANNLMSIFKYQDRIELVMIDDHSRIYPLPRQFKKRYAAGTDLSLIPFGEVNKVVSRGLVYNLNGENLISGIRTSSSNRVSEEEWVEISHEGGFLLMMECRD